MAESTVDLLVGRQPIFTRDRGVVGYELLFRSSGEADIAAMDGDALTSGVVLGAAAIGLDHLVGSKLAFVNADHGRLTGAVPVLMPPRRTVLEVLESVRIDGDVLAGCRRLRSLGYRLALDDFVWFDGAEALLALASIVKIDIQAVPRDELPRLMARCRRYAVTLLAEKVETEQELRHCAELGFELFQGYLLSRPQVIAGHTLDSGSLGHIRLAAALVNDAEFDVDQLEQIVRTDPALSVQLLQLAGLGADHGMRRTVQSFRDALVLLGWRQLQNWMAFLVLIQRGRASHEQVTVALARARMCELLCGPRDGGAAGMAFAAGMLSALDLLFGAPLDEILDGLPLSADLRAAALTHEGAVGRIVRRVIDYQSGAYESTGLPEMPAHRLHRAAGQALTWAVQATEAWDQGSRRPA